MPTFFPDILSKPLNASCSWGASATNKCLWWKYSGNPHLEYCRRVIDITVSAGQGCIGYACSQLSIPLKGWFLNYLGGSTVCNVGSCAPINSNIVGLSGYYYPCSIPSNPSDYVDCIELLGNTTYGTITLRIRPWLLLANGVFSSSLAIQVYITKHASLSPSFNVNFAETIASDTNYCSPAPEANFLAEPASYFAYATVPRDLTPSDYPCSAINNTNAKIYTLTIYDDGTVTLV